MSNAFFSEILCTQVPQIPMAITLKDCLSPHGDSKGRAGKQNSRPNSVPRVSPDHSPWILFAPIFGRFCPRVNLPPPCRYYITRGERAKD